MSYILIFSSPPNLILIYFPHFLLSPYILLIILLLSLTVCFIMFQVDRLMEMHFKYLEAVQQADKRIEGEKHVGTSPFPPILSLTVLLSVCCIRNLVGRMRHKD